MQRDDFFHFSPELRLDVYRNPEDFSVYNEYHSNTEEMNYSHPEFYQPSGEQFPYADPMEAPATNPTTDPTAEAAPKKARRGLLGRIGAALVALGAWLLKLKGVLFLLKFGTVGLSAFVSAVVYAWIFGWPFAIGLIALLFIHEMGHALVMKLKGMPIGGMIFVPLLGAAVLMQQMPSNARDEAEVGIAGPIAGTLAATVCLLLAAYQPHSIWAPLAYFGFFMNLFNLVPIVPFDGGRVMAAIDRRAWFLGFVLLIGYGVWEWMHGSFNTFLLLFIIMGAVQLWSRGGSSGPDRNPTYYQVPLVTRITLTLTYFGLAAVLLIGMNMAHGLMPGAQ